MSGSSQGNNSPESYRIGFWRLLPIVLSSQIGSGTFFIPALLAPFGIIGLFSWFYTGAGAVLLAVLFGLLCKKIPQTGGPHAYICQAFGDKIGFFAGWSYWVVSWLSTLVLLFVITGALQQVFEISAGVCLMIELSLLLLVTLTNLLGMHTSSLQNAILAIMKMVPIFLVCIVGWFFVDFDNYFNSIVLAPPSIVGDGSFFAVLNAASLLTLWGFVGVETATTPAEHVKDIKRVMFKALVIGEICVCLIYLLSCFSVYGILSQSVLMNSSAPYVDALRVIFNSPHNRFIPFLIIPVCLASLNTWTLVSGQIALGAAKSGIFPEFFGKKNKHGAPYWSVILSSVGQIPFLVAAKNDTFLEKVTQIADFSSTVFLMVYFLCAIAFIKIFKKQYLAIGIGAILFCSWVLIGARSSILYAAIIPISGLPLFIYMRNCKKVF